MGEWEDIPKNAMIYIPGTEYGGIYRQTEVDSKQGYVSIGGRTWRGMLQNKVYIFYPEVVPNILETLL